MHDTKRQIFGPRYQPLKSTIFQILKTPTGGGKWNASRSVGSSIFLGEYLIELIFS